VSRLALALALLVLVYALTLGSFDPLDLAVGAAIGAAALAGFRRFLLVGPGLPAGEIARRAVHLVPLVLATMREISVGTWHVALVVLGLRPLRSPGVVVIPFEERSPTGVAVTAIIATLSPGEFLVEIDWERGEILMHVIDASDPDAVRAHHRQFYRRYQRPVFP
jgi:multicomponent Na+:H+ antiporter subunit E